VRRRGCGVSSVLPAASTSKRTCVCVCVACVTCVLCGCVRWSTAWRCPPRSECTVRRTRGRQHARARSTPHHLLGCVRVDLHHARALELGQHRQPLRCRLCVHKVGDAVVHRPREPVRWWHTGNAGHVVAARHVRVPGVWRRAGLAVRCDRDSLLHDARTWRCHSPPCSPTSSCGSPISRRPPCSRARQPLPLCRPLPCSPSPPAPDEAARGVGSVSHAAARRARTPTPCPVAP
jgi:hypothetical protein